MMNKLLGEKMVEEQLVTRQQLREALGRQRLHGGRLGHNLVALGYLSEDQLGKFFQRTPPVPSSLEETGLTLEFVTDLALKHILHMGEFRLADLSVHGELLAAARDDARLIVERDPELSGPRGAALRVLLYLFERDEAVKTVRSG